MKTRAAFNVLLLMLLAGLSVFAAGSPQDVPPTDYFVGKYDVIGRKPDSDVTYSGTVELKTGTDAKFVLIRRINGRETRGTAAIDRANPPADRPLVLRVRFNEEGHEYEGVFLWRSDFDNYPRVSGYINEIGKTKSSGLEAWFVGKR